jgi:hypothetical protein
LHEYQTKRLTKFAFRKWLILKDMFLVEQEGQGGKSSPKKEKQQQAAALHIEFSIASIIPWAGEKSRKSFGGGSVSE